MTMSVTQENLADLCRSMGRSAKDAAGDLAALDTAIKDRWLIESARRLRDSIDEIVDANQVDLAAAPAYGLSDAAVDRLRLTPERIEGIAKALEEIAALRDPVGEVIEGFTRPGGLQILKRRVPLGVVFFIYESRPNVTADAAAICIKSGNAVILRGGKEAIHSSGKIVELMNDAGARCGLPDGAVQLVGTTDRDAVGHFLKMSDCIDVAIPRGGESLIRRVAAEATMPVIKHFDGNCHVYVDRYADLEMAVKVIVNAKCQRMGVCNACESLLIHRDIAEQFLPPIAEALRRQGIELRVDDRAGRIVPDAVPATEEDFRTEYLGPILSVAVADSVLEACDHINRYGSHHTDAIITQDIAAAETFVDRVDSSAVMVNASTRFNDGGMFGLGAEIGISTDKFHARGPCGLKELTTYKYIVRGNGHIRE